MRNTGSDRNPTKAGARSPLPRAHRPDDTGLAADSPVDIAPIGVRKLPGILHRTGA